MDQLIGKVQRRGLFGLAAVVVAIPAVAKASAPRMVEMVEADIAPVEFPPMPPEDMDEFTRQYYAEFYTGLEQRMEATRGALFRRCA